MAKIEYEEKIKRKEEMISQYIKDNKLDISTINNIVSPDLRISILTWISNANMNPDKVANTEFGKKFKLIKNEGTCILHCSDGDITMPRYIMEFENECD